MTKAKRLIIENLSLVHVVIELLDARIPISSRNPDIENIVQDKPRIIVLNKADMADEKVTQQWIKYFTNQGKIALAYQSTAKGTQNSKKIMEAIKLAAKVELERRERKGIRSQNIRTMVLGVPNVGKSTFINALVKKSIAKTGDKPGITRGKQWIKLSGELDLLDTPGILWPKFEDPEVGFKLAVTGAISDQVFDWMKVTLDLLILLKEYYPSTLKERFKLDELPEDNSELLELIGIKRGCLIKGGEVDTEKAAGIVLQECRTGKLGAISFDRPII